MEFHAIVNTFWISSICALVIHQLFQHYLGIHWHFADAYLDAFLSMPILLGLMRQERRFLIDVFLKQLNAKDYQFSGLQTAIAGALLAVVFEELLPRFCAGYTRDNWDYVAYGVGIVAFHFLINGTAHQDAPIVPERATGESIPVNGFRNRALENNGCHGERCGDAVKDFDPKVRQTNRRQV